MGEKKFQLNLITSVFIVTLSGFRVAFYFSDVQGLSLVSSSGLFFYIVSNPFVYMFVMVDLREHYRRYFRSLITSFLTVHHTTRVSAQLRDYPEPHVIVNVNG